MPTPRFSWRRNPFVLGLLLGWLIGMLWWTGLMIAFGPSVIVTGENGIVTETQISVLSRLRYAPLVAIPWALVGLLVGWWTAAAQNRAVAVIACIGLIVGGTASISTNPFDGWLAMIMPLCCLGGAVAGAIIAVTAIALWRLIRTGQIE